MKRNTFVTLGIVAVVPVAAALLATLITVLSEGAESTLHVHVLSSRTDTNGSQTVSLLLTNGSSKTFPWLATTAPNGQAPYYVIETKTKEGWSRTTPFTNFWFSHHFLAAASWEIEASLPTSERARRVVFFYTVGQRNGPWLLRQAHSLLKNLTLEKDMHELRSPILEPNPQGRANGKQPFDSETNRTSAAAASQARTGHREGGQFSRVDLYPDRPIKP